ncbi:GAF domain-containing sensor histidine kinase [Anaerolineales bacterium HSG6]|nr:GAF domain-containing sensor histidine kinase [Anaerolineales bacterium HSG6]MDM8532626.1 GAF domain-containing sensor histidine kinase [Anaerolineales bacterium HSG25]
MLKYLGNKPEEPNKPEAKSVEDTNDAVLEERPTTEEVLSQMPDDALPSGLEQAREPASSNEELSVVHQKLARAEQRITYLERIVKVSQILNSTLTLEPLLQIIIQAATELINTDACSILLIDKNSGELRFAEVTGGVTEALRDVSIPLDDSIAGLIVRTDKPFLIRDVRNDPRWHDKIDHTIDFETKSILGVPLKVRDQVIGALEVVNKRSEEGFTQDDIQIATTLASQAAVALENARLLDELQIAYRNLSELDQIKSDFVSIAAHELRTPLAVILGYANFLRESVQGQASEQLEIVLDSAMHLRTLIGDMVNLHHIQTNKVLLDRSVFSLRQLILDVMEEFSDLVKGKGQSLTKKFTPTDDPLNIDGDRKKVYLVFANLISNAVKFTGEKGRIHINIQLKGYKYHINVIDTGIGIAEGDYERIFDQFHQVEPSLTRNYQGMGLGLSIAKGMVEVHQGRIWVQSVVGKGSNFNVVLPSAPEQ